MAETVDDLNTTTKTNRLQKKPNCLQTLHSEQYTHWHTWGTDVERNINPLHNFTSDTEDEYPVFIDDTKNNSDTPFIYCDANNDPESYTKYESDTRCSSYDTSKDHNTMKNNTESACTKLIPGPSAEISLKASCIPRPHKSKCSLQDHHTPETLQDIRTTWRKKSTWIPMTRSSCTPVPRIPTISIKYAFQDQAALEML